MAEKELPARPDEIRDLPVIPSDAVLFPHMIVPFVLTEPGLVKAVEEALSQDRMVAVVAVKDPKAERKELFQFGTLALILRASRVELDRVRIVVQGLSRIQVLSFVENEPFLMARVQLLAETFSPDREAEALAVNIRQMFGRVLELSPHLPGELRSLVENLEDPGMLADLSVAHLNVPHNEKQALLETLDVKARLHKAVRLVAEQLEVLELGQKIQAEVRDRMEKAQKEYYLREQLKVIRKELGEAEGLEAEVEELEEKLEKKALPEMVRKEAEKELKKLSRTHPASAEYTVIRNYLDWILELPWLESTEEHLDISEAERILDEDHYDLEKVKKRILEYLAVRKLNPEMKGPILCFLGPPGVGKTSLGRSIARALGRKFWRISLGGVRDEAEIRGHRRTYVGAMPGRIIQALRRVGVNNPVLMLDEIDKIGADFRGDPAAALLEVLDPEQNREFSDHYLELPFDLSRVIFIATANVIDTIPAPLRDRMEVIEIPGYTEEDKLHIARKYLIPRQLKAHGLKRGQVRFTEAALRRIISHYTREAGVRQLEREIGAVCRAVARKVAEGESSGEHVTVKNLEEYLGPPKYLPEVPERVKVPGVAIGLAWTPVGGEILFVEAARMKGTRKLILTGQLGEVMRESAEAAFTYVRSHVEELGIDEEVLERSDFHIHVPSGAIPKDGPSAGITILTALVSLLTGRTVRPEVAMTGEITLRGLVLPVGGIKEKVLAARRFGLKEVILPRRNEKDLTEVPEEVRKSLKFHLVSRVEEVFPIVFKDWKRKA
ncbi:endopeptidase La [Thermosulfurimonas dismutans]|uniref:Lon protease n=1 Tax=Thermosulfurimonas dismutans TaxID=999894 RepID=A0A179D3G9_9BACT|nr:endopeptidase La [Thermosulfurimonas dismutans]OAQ20605.1 ATP-dependent protease La Type I [Thermosulfurimonas dismutans]